MSAAALRTRPLIADFGVEIMDVDLASAHAATLAAVHDTFHRHGAILPRGQRLDKPGQLDFTRLFGEPEYNARTEWCDPDYPEIYVISNKVVNGRKIGDERAGLGWHSDFAYGKRPALCTILNAVEVPKEGSDTELADLCADVFHPLIRRHPADQRKALWVGTSTVKGISGMPNPEGLDLIAELVAFATQERFVYRHKWRVDDVLAWDNRCTLHRGTEFDFENDTRLVYRSWVKGDVPV
jgi:taurine dioxygenase